MALSSIDIVRNGIGDTETPYVFADAVITDYLALYSGDTDDTITAMRPLMLSTLATTAGRSKVGDLEQDNKDAAKNYMNYLRFLREDNKETGTIAARGYPIIGGTTLPSTIGIDTFMDKDFLNEENREDY